MLIFGLILQFCLCCLLAGMPFLLPDHIYNNKMVCCVHAQVWNRIGGICTSLAECRISVLLRAAFCEPVVTRLVVSAPMRILELCLTNPTNFAHNLCSAIYLANEILAVQQ